MSPAQVMAGSAVVLAGAGAILIGSPDSLPSARARALAPDPAGPAGSAAVAAPAQRRAGHDAGVRQVLAHLVHAARAALPAATRWDRMPTYR